MNTHVLITFPKLTPIEVGQIPDDETELEIKVMPGWDEAFRVFGPAPRSTCEAAAANLDHETTVFVVSELQSLDVPSLKEGENDAS